MLALRFPCQLKDDVISRVGQRHRDFGRLPSPLLTIADELEEEGLKLRPAGFHTLIGNRTILRQMSIYHVNTPKPSR